MKNKGLKIGLTSLVLALTFGGLLYTTMAEGTEYYKHVDEVMAQPDQWYGKKLQLHGFVVPNSINRKPGSMDYWFQVQSSGQIVSATYTGVVPDTFKSDSEVVLKGMLSSEAHSGSVLTIYRFKVEPDVLPGEYRYHVLLVTPRTRREREFNGRLELVVNMVEGGQNAMMSFPEPGDASASEFRLVFKYFRRVEGTFRVNPKARVESVQVRIFETGSNQPRAIQTLSL